MVRSCSPTPAQLIPTCVIKHERTGILIFSSSLKTAATSFIMNSFVFIWATLEKQAALIAGLWMRRRLNASFFPRQACDVYLQKKKNKKDKDSPENPLIP